MFAGMRSSTRQACQEPVGSERWLGLEAVVPQTISTMSLNTERERECHVLRVFTADWILPTSLQPEVHPNSLLGRWEEIGASEHGPLRLHQPEMLA